MSNQKDTIELKVVAKLPWNDQVQLEVVDVKPPAGGSFLQLPGPNRRPVRPYLEPFVSAGGLAARFVGGNGKVAPVIVLGGETVKVLSVPEPPLALSMREDGGVWALTQNRLTHYDDKGTPLCSIGLSGQVLVGSVNNAVWVVGAGNQTAWLVDANGRIRGKYAWKGGINSTGGEGGLLCTLDKGKSPQLRCLTSHGKERSIALPVSPRPMEQLPTLTDREILTVSGSTLRRYDSTGLVAQITIQSAGFTDTGKVFMSGREGYWIHLWVTRGEPQRLPLPSSLPEWGAVTVVAIEDERSLVYGLDYAAWYNEVDIKETFVVDELSYRNEVFPHLWSLSRTRFVTATPDGRIILSVAGPIGVALIELHWRG